MKNLIDKDTFDWMVSLRRDIHQYPELSWQENRTAEKIIEALEELNISYRRMLDTGIIADLPGPKGMPKVALRADIDALPIQEETALPFASKVPGVMHACGHDGHTSILLGVARMLQMNGNLPVPVRLIFQPAEEKGSGAKAMVKAGALDGVAVIFGGHLDRHFPCGTLVVTSGPVNASTDSFRIEISSKGGHAARPHESVDAVVVGSLMVIALQTIVSREVNPAHPAVVSVGRFEAGTVANAIAGQATLEGTIRTQEPEVRDHFEKAINRIAKSVGKLHGANVMVYFKKGYPILNNSPEMAELARCGAIRVVGEENIRKLHLANMGGEDFSYYLEKIPGCYIRYGAQKDGEINYPAHSSKFDFDERAIEYGAAWLCEMTKVVGQHFLESQSHSLISRTQQD